MTETSKKGLEDICSFLDEEANAEGFDKHKHANIIRALATERDALQVTVNEMQDALENVVDRLGGDFNSYTMDGMVIANAKGILAKHRR